MSRSTNSNKNMKKNAIRPYTVMCTDIYLLWILIVFPLYYADGYFHLPEKKATFWVTSTLVYVVVCLLGAVITAFSMKENWSMENFKKNITMTDIFMFGFLISNLIALAMSNDVKESWMATGGRYYGARVLLLVCVVYFLISRYAWVNQVFIVAFLIGGNGVCLLATFDYFGMDVLGINQQMQITDWLSFISTMGNANTCASYVTMALAGALCYFCVAKGVKVKVFAGISIVNCSMALVTARSDSAFVGIAVVVIVLWVLAFAKEIELKSYIMMLALMDVGLLILFILRKRFIDHLILEDWETGLPRALNQPMMLVVILIILLVVYELVLVLEKRNIKLEKKAMYIIFSVVGVAFIAVMIFLINKLNVFNLFKIAMGMEENLVVASRGYIYQKTVLSYMELPFINKIFGCGQASIRTVLSTYFGAELSAVGLSINSAHNHILDYLIITGLFGIICYLGTLMSVVKHAFMAFKEDKNAIVFVGCVIAYFAQGVFNIEQTNTTTIFWLMLACCETVYRKSVMKKEEY